MHADSFSVVGVFCRDIVCHAAQLEHVEQALSQALDWLAGQRQLELSADPRFPFLREVRPAFGIV